MKRDDCVLVLPRQVVAKLYNQKQSHTDLDAIEAEIWYNPQEGPLLVPLPCVSTVFVLSTPLPCGSPAHRLPIPLPISTKRVGTSKYTCLDTRDIHKMQIQFQSSD